MFSKDESVQMNKLLILITSLIVGVPLYGMIAEQDERVEQEVTVPHTKIRWCYGEGLRAYPILFPKTSGAKSTETDDIHFHQVMRAMLFLANSLKSWLAEKENIHPINNPMPDYKLGAEDIRRLMPRTNSFLMESSDCMEFLLRFICSSYSAEHVHFILNKIQMRTYYIFGTSYRLVQINQPLGYPWDNANRGTGQKYINDVIERHSGLEFVRAYFNCYAAESNYQLLSRLYQIEEVIRPVVPWRELFKEDGTYPLPVLIHSGHLHTLNITGIEEIKGLNQIRMYVSNNDMLNAYPPYGSNIS